MVAINSGYLKKCKDSVGGVNTVYLFSYESYRRSQIVLNDNYLTSFPTTIIYKFDSSEPVSINNDMSENDGGKFYNQNLDFTFVGGELVDWEKLIRTDFRAIYKDNNGLYRILGLYNGIRSKTLTYNTGGSKGSLNGFKISFEGIEKNDAYYITDLEDAGFFTEANFRITQDGFIRVTQNNDRRIV